MTAIIALKTIGRENRRATPEEQRQLARYVGGLANAFRNPEGETIAARLGRSKSFDEQIGESTAPPWAIGRKAGAMPGHGQRG